MICARAFPCGPSLCAVNGSWHVGKMRGSHLVSEQQTTVSEPLPQWQFKSRLSTGTKLTVEFQEKRSIWFTVWFRRKIKNDDWTWNVTRWNMTKVSRAETKSQLNIYMSSWYLISASIPSQHFLRSPWQWRSLLQKSSQGWRLKATRRWQAASINVVWNTSDCRSRDSIVFLSCYSLFYRTWINQ